MVSSPSLSDRYWGSYVRDEALKELFARWTRERPSFDLSAFLKELHDPRGHQQMLSVILPLLSEYRCEIGKKDGGFIVRWRQEEEEPCRPDELPPGRMVDAAIQDQIESYITATTRKPWDDSETLKKIQDAVIAQKENYWKEGEKRQIRYTDEYSIFAYLAYHFPVYYIQMRHLLSELMQDGLLPKRMAVLDVGSGPGTVTLALRSILAETPGCHAAVHAIEHSDAWREAYQALVPAICEGSNNCATLPPIPLDITDPDAPLPEGPYDLIVCANILNEIPEKTVREAVVMRLAGTLRETGALLISEPADLVNATELRNLSRRLHDRGLSIFAPCLDIRGVPCSVQRCWSFIQLPEVKPTRLMTAVAATDEPYRFYNTDIKAAFAIHNKDGRKRIDYTVPRTAKADRISRLHLHVGKKINVIAQKISENIGDSGTYLYRICDGTGKREAYAALPAYHIADKNSHLRRAAYGSVLRFDRVLVRHHKKYDAYHLLLTKESGVELVAGKITKEEPEPPREARKETKQGFRRRAKQQGPSKTKKSKKK